MAEQLTEWMGNPLVSRFAEVAITLLVVFILVRAVQAVIARYVEDRAMRYRIRKGIGFAGYLLAALLVVFSFADKLDQLAVVLGFATAGVAFALQELIASVAGWIAVSFGGYYKAGDRIQLGGVRGDVIDIGVLRTTVAEIGEWVQGDLYSGRVVRVPNSKVFKDPVVNYSGDFPFLWDEIAVPIRHGSDLIAAQALMEQAARDICGGYQAEAAAIWRAMAKRYPLEDASTAPLVTCVFDQNWVTFTVRYAVRFNKRRSTKSDLSTAILTAIGATDGRVSVAAAAIEVFPMKPLEVQTSSPD